MKLRMSFQKIVKICILLSFVEIIHVCLNVDKRYNSLTVIDIY